MQNLFSPLMNMYQNQLDASRRCAEAFFSGTGKIDRMLIDATHRAFDNQMNFVQEITTAQDPRALGNTVRSRFMSRNSDEAVNYQKEIIQIYAEMQNEIGKSMQDCIERLGMPATGNATRGLETSPEQANDAAFNPMTSMFSVWESAFKDVAALAKKNMLAGASNIGTDFSKRQTVDKHADVVADHIQQSGSADAMSEEGGSAVKEHSSLAGSKKK
ncbi:MAG TPA: phasin family protein [Noviherbaspirillum sp.]|nr:phasin family protein [Noviherbaspirillum sp.]